MQGTSDMRCQSTAQQAVTLNPPLGRWPWPREEISFPLNGFRSRGMGALSAGGGYCSLVRIGSNPRARRAAGSVVTRAGMTQPPPVDQRTLEGDQPEIGSEIRKNTPTLGESFHHIGVSRLAHENQRWQSRGQQCPLARVSKPTPNRTHNRSRSPR